MVDTENQFQTTPVIIKKLHIPTNFKPEIVTQQSKSEKAFNDKIKKEEVKLLEKLTKISEKVSQKLQDDHRQLTEKLITFLKRK